MGETRARPVVRAHATIPSPRPPLRPSRRRSGASSADARSRASSTPRPLPSLRRGSVHDKTPQVVLVLRAVEDPKTGEVNEALQVARLLLFASIDRAGLHHVTYPGRDGVEYLGLSADEMRLIKEADRLGVEMRLGRASQHPAIEMTRGGKMRWPRRGRIVDGAFVEDNENGELITGKQFRDAAHKKPSVYYFGAEFEDVRCGTAH